MTEGRLCSNNIPTADTVGCCPTQLWCSISLHSVTGGNCAASVESIASNDLCIPAGNDVILSQPVPPSLLFFYAWPLRLLFVYLFSLFVSVCEWSSLTVVETFSLSLSINTAAIKCNQHDFCVQEGQVFSMLVKWAHSVTRLLNVCFGQRWGEVHPYIVDLT